MALLGGEEIGELPEHLRQARAGAVLPKHLRGGAVRRLGIRRAAVLAVQARQRDEGGRLRIGVAG